VPKKGYVLHAKVVFDGPQRESFKYVHGARRGKFILAAAVVFILIVAAFFIYKSRQAQKQFNPDIIPAAQGFHANDTTRENANPDKLPDTVKKVQPDADKVK
jgi:hypothetical protein